VALNKKYIILKDDDAGVDLEKLKKWVDIVVKNDAKGSIGVIGKHLNDKKLQVFLNSLDQNTIEIFCHGYYHTHSPYYLNKIIRRNLPKTEFNKDKKNHGLSLKKYREDERKYLNSSTVSFGPQGNIWNENIIDPLLQNSFKLMFSWENVGGGIHTIPLSSNFRQNSLEEFIKSYERKKDDLIYTLQFHHAKLTDKKFKLMEEVIDFLKNKEKRIFVTPSELLEISKNDKEIYSLMIGKND